MTMNTWRECKLGDLLADKARRMGWYMAAGIVAQIYVVFRVTAGRKPAAAKT